MAIGLLSTLIIAVMGGILDEVQYGAGDVFFGIAGIGFFIFGVWASVLLLLKK